MIRSSCLDVFCKKDVLKNFAKCTRKHQCWRLFNNKVESLKRATLSEKKQRCRWLLVSFAKFPRTNTTTPGHCLRKITPAVYCSTTVFRLVLKFRVISHIFSSRGLSGSSLQTRNKSELKLEIDKSKILNVEQPNFEHNWFNLKN